MIVTHKENNRVAASNNRIATEVQHERWAHCHVNWTATALGTLAALSILLLFGLLGIALGAHLLGPEHRIVDMKKFGIGALIFCVCGAFFSGIVGGWVSARTAGILNSEPAIIHGAIVWLVTVPILVVGGVVGAASLFGGWYAGLSPNSAASANAPFTRPDAPRDSATPAEVNTYNNQLADYNRNVKQWQDDTPKVVRNSAMVSITALLLALLGSVIGAWMASGEPMNFSHYRTRKPLYHIP